MGRVKELKALLFGMEFKKYDDDALYDAAQSAYQLDGEEKVELIDELLRRWTIEKVKAGAPRTSSV